MSERKPAREPREEALEIWRRAFGGGSTSDEDDAGREGVRQHADRGGEALRDQSDEDNGRSRRG